MDSSAGGTLTGLIPALKAEWARRLRDEPPLSALGRRDTIQFLIEATLLQLVAMLPDPAGRPPARPPTPLVGPVFSYCACGLEPMRRYFAAGEATLRTVLGEKSGLEAGQVLPFLRELAEREARSLCQPCPRQGSAVCLLGASSGGTGPASSA